MSAFGASAAVAILLGWVVFAFAGLWVSAPVAVTAGAVAGVLCAGLARDTLGVTGVVAVMAPFGVMLPALAARHMAVALGMDIPGFTTPEIAVFLVLYVAFLCTAFGVIPVDLYRLGYAPGAVGAMVLALCAYAALTGNWFLAAVAVLGQVAWLMGWSSSNWFDLVLHVFLVPVAGVVLLLRMV